MTGRSIWAMRDIVNLGRGMLNAYAVLAITALGISGDAYAVSQQTSENIKPPQIGTEGKPLVIDVARTRKTLEETNQEKKDRENKEAADKRLGDLTEDLAKSTKDLSRATDTLIV